MMAIETMLAIETKNLTRTFNNKTAVDSIDLRVPTGSIYGFLGPNGAEKTTTIRMLLGLIKPSAGEICILGKSRAEQRQNILGEIGALVELPSLYPHLTGWENLQITALLRNVSKERIDEVLGTVGLQEARDKKVKEYSLGMKQRLGLAQALLSSPKLLILDEPTNGLDPAGIREMRELIIALPKQFGTTVFLSSHLLHEVERVATHIGVLHHGKLIFQGPIGEFRKDDKNLEDVFMYLTEAV